MASKYEEQECLYAAVGKVIYEGLTNYEKATSANPSQLFGECAPLLHTSLCSLGRASLLGGALSQCGVERVCEWPGAPQARFPGVLEMEAQPQSFFLPQTHVLLPTPHLQGCLKVHGVSFYGTFTAGS